MFAWLIVESRMSGFLVCWTDQQKKGKRILMQKCFIPIYMKVMLPKLSIYPYHLH